MHLKPKLDTSIMTLKFYFLNNNTLIFPTLEKKKCFCVSPVLGDEMCVELFHKGHPGDCIKMWSLAHKGFLQCCALALSGNLD
jgi:hypothetical protein